MKQIFKSRERIVVSLIIIAFAVLFSFTTTIYRKVILEFTRFHAITDSMKLAMQLKNGNLSYFLSLYGFQPSQATCQCSLQSFTPYLQGGLVLINALGFRYQIVSRVLLHILSEFSMYALLKQCKVRQHCLVTRFTQCDNILYPILDDASGFSSWGPALLPFVYSAIHYVFYQKVETN